MISLFFFIIDLYFLIHAVIAKMYDANAELAISTGIPFNKVKAEIETHPVVAEARISHCSM